MMRKGRDEERRKGVCRKCRWENDAVGRRDRREKVFGEMRDEER